MGYGKSLFWVNFIFENLLHNIYKLEKLYLYECTIILWNDKREINCKTLLTVLFNYSIIVIVKKRWLEWIKERNGSSVNAISFPNSILLKFYMSGFMIMQCVELFNLFVRINY